MWRGGNLALSSAIIFLIQTATSKHFYLHWRGKNKDTCNFCSGGTYTNQRWLCSQKLAGEERVNMPSTPSAIHLLAKAVPESSFAKEKSVLKNKHRHNVIWEVPDSESYL